MDRGRIAGPGTFTLDAGSTGEIHSNAAPDNGGLDGVSLLNRGALSVFDLPLRDGATHRNEGTLVLPAGAYGVRQGTGGGSIVNAATFQLSTANGFGGRTVEVSLINLANTLIQIDANAGLNNTFNSIDNSGTLSIGAQGDDDGFRRYVVVNGDYIQQASGTLHVEQAQLSSIPSYPSGTLFIKGTAQLSGTVEVHFVPNPSTNDNTPRSGQAWTVLKFATKVGDFTTFVNLDASSGIAVDPVSDQNRVRIVAR